MTTSTQRQRAGNYGRQSAGNALSVADQHRSNARECATHDWDEVRRYSDLVSASRFGTKQRDEWRQLGDDVVAGRLDVIVMWDTSRGDRKVATWAAFIDQCRDASVLIHATSHRRTYDPRIPRDWRVLIDDGVEAAYDSEAKSLAVLRGIQGAAEAGKPHGAPGYGLQRVYDQHNRKVFTDVPDDNAPVVREIFQRCAKEEPLTHICADLNAREIPSPKGGTWTPRVVKQIATHPRYVGVRIHQGESYQGNWETLVDEALFAKSVAVLTAPDRRKSPPGKKKYLLTYLATAHCGGRLNVDPGEAQRPARYRCIDCGCTTIRMDSLDDVVVDLVLARLANEDVRAFFLPPGAEVAAAEREQERLQARLDEARESFAQPDGISATALAQLERAIQPELDAVKSKLQTLTVCAAGLELLGEGQFRAEVGRPRWDALPLAGRRSVIRALIDTIEIGPAAKRLTRWTSDEERMWIAEQRTNVVWRKPGTPVQQDPEGDLDELLDGTGW